MYKGENNDDMETNGELQFMRRILPQCTTVFDVGANVGDWTALALSVNPHLIVHCFEPSKTAYQRLLAHKFPLKVICNNFGLSSVAGEMTLHVFEDGSGGNSLYRRQGLEDGWRLATQKLEEIVYLETLDEYCHRNGVRMIDFLKIDVEGHEFEVLKGASGMVSNGKIKVIQFEYGGCNIDARVFLKDFFDFFKPFSYTFYKIYPKCLKRVERYDQRLENFQYQNWVITKNAQSFSS
jgi:FkbM family methyltransferase